MHRRSSVRFIVAALCAALITSCGGSSSGKPPISTSASQNTGQYAPGTKVAVVGDSEAEVSANIQTAQTLGLSPQYVSIQTSSRSHVFTVYAQVLRSQQAVIVRAYGSVYAFLLSQVNLSEGGITVRTDSLPLVAAPTIDKFIAEGRQPGDFKYNAAAKLQLCPDCVLMFLELRNAPTSWAASSDPWQASTTYIAWSPAASGAGKPAPPLPAFAGSSYGSGNCRLESNRGQPVRPDCIVCVSNGGCYNFGGGSGGRGGGGSSGGGNPPPRCSLGCRIAAAAAAFVGPHNCGSAIGDSPGEGCMWSVDQVLTQAGAGQLGNGSYYIPTAVGSAGNQITVEPAGYVAQQGDLVDWWGGDQQTTFAGCESDQNCGEHIGVCLSLTACTVAIANSTSASIASGECQFIDYGSAASPQAQSSSFTNATIIHVNY